MSPFSLVLMLASLISMLAVKPSPTHTLNTKNPLKNLSPHHRFCPSSSSGLELSAVLLGPAKVEDNNALLPDVAIFAGLVNLTGYPDVAAAAAVS